MSLYVPISSCRDYRLPLCMGLTNLSYFTYVHECFYTSPFIVLTRSSLFENYIDLIRKRSSWPFSANVDYVYLFLSYVFIYPLHVPKPNSIFVRFSLLRKVRSAMLMPLNSSPVFELSPVVLKQQINIKIIYALN